MRLKWVAKLILLGERMTARGTLTGLKSEQVWNQLSYTWAAAMPCVNTGWVMNRLREALRRRTWEYNGWKTLHDLEMCDVSMESHRVLGSIKRTAGSRWREGIPLLNSHEIPAGVLHAALVTATQERNESVVGGRKEGHAEAPWGGAILLGR